MRASKYRFIPHSPQIRRMNLVPITVVTVRPSARCSVLSPANASPLSKPTPLNGARLIAVRCNAKGAKSTWPAVHAVLNPVSKEMTTAAALPIRAASTAASVLTGKSWTAMVNAWNLAVARARTTTRSTLRVHESEYGRTRRARKSANARMARSCATRTHRCRARQRAVRATSSRANPTGNAFRRTGDVIVLRIVPTVAMNRKVTVKIDV